MNMKTNFTSLFILLALLVTVTDCKPRQRSISEKTTDDSSIFSIPFSNVRIGQNEFLVNPSVDTILIYSSGTEIHVPENAFLNSAGNAVTGNVRLTYREFSDAFDIYLGGIPMQYDSAGVEQVFETAGMIEINAYSEGQPVFVNPENKIMVEMNSNDPDPKFNVYSLDTTTGQWDYQSRGNVKSTTYADELEKLPQIPPEPKKAGSFAFTVKDCTGGVPELDIYRNVLFEPVDGKRHGFQATNIKVKDLENGKYRVTFILFDGKNILKKDSCDCYLSFKEGENYDNALNTYRNKYSRQIAKREKVRKEIEAEWESYNNALVRYYNSADSAIKRYRTSLKKREIDNIDGLAKITRTLEINGFGYINFDYPTEYPMGADLLAVYKDSIGNDLILKDVVMAESGRNALFKCKNRIRFNPKKDNILWGITSDNRLAVFKVRDFKRIDKYTGEYTFVMKVYPDSLKTYEEICNALF